MRLPLRVTSAWESRFDGGSGKNERAADAIVSPDGGLLFMTG